MTPLRKAWYILRYLGPGFVATRLRIALDQRTGALRRRFRTRPWNTIALGEILRPGVPSAATEYAAYKRSAPPPFLFPLGEPPRVDAAQFPAAGPRRPTLLERVALWRQRRAVLFLDQVTPGPVDYYASPLTGGRSTPGRVWCDLSDFDPAQGDIRTLWESARAAWALDLLRAAARGAAPDAGAVYWQALDEWMAACPPFTGVQWKCGQESSVRLSALLLAAWGLANDAATTPARWVQLARLTWATGYRVYHHIDYAVSQKNNHAISEACGLLLAAQLFPELRDADAWRARGRDVLTRELRRQIYADGSYVQHSLNYQRVMLHGAVLGLRLAELSGQPLPRDVYERVGAAGQFLADLLEPGSGQVPQYGNNDGALVLPLSECGFTDYRPVVQAAYYLAHGRRTLPAGPWDEDLLWLWGPAALDADARATPGSQAPPAPGPHRFDAGGYYTLRRPTTWALVRCHTYRDRPGQQDALHVDLWWRGVNVLTDAGSFRYYCPDAPAVERYFGSRAAHNALDVPGYEPHESASRFLRFPWPRGRLLAYETSHAEAQWLTVACDDYRRHPSGLVHERTLVSFADECWLVIDDFAGRGAPLVRLRWHLADVPIDELTADQRWRLVIPDGSCELALGGAAPRSVELLRGLETPARVEGWVSPYYGRRAPAPVIVADYEAPLPLRVLTAFGPADVDPAALLARWNALAAARTEDVAC